MTTQGLAAFGVAPTGGLAYLYDAERQRIIGEGDLAAVRGKTREWEPVTPGRYRALTGDRVDTVVLLEWQRFRETNEYWRIRDEQ